MLTVFKKISTILTIDKDTGFRKFMKSGVGGNSRIFSSNNVHKYGYWVILCTKHRKHNVILTLSDRYLKNIMTQAVAEHFDFRNTKCLHSEDVGSVIQRI
jgi:hypothetical protein